MGRKLKAGVSAAKPAGSADGLRSGSGPQSAPAPKDTLLIHGVSADGETMAVLRAREDRVEAGVLRAVKEGQPFGSGEVLKLTPRPDFPLLCDVEVQVPAHVVNASGGSDSAPQASLGRPAQVATDAYRENWDAIWRKPGKKSLAN
jgi:hypothetical protein